ncbi:hypothetical protein HPP92_025737 [Vanilla planifolia]|uniref:UspA domain-containing protein n=1 Tax=Vanilla planifolia TaxID=51239 RepID=A0A835UAS5_VANPL|nr:hypothetical protein HPP92_025737 [Vanilla planifolia]
MTSSSSSMPRRRTAAGVVEEALSPLLRRPVSIGPGIGGWSAFVGSNHHSALSLISSVSLSSGSTAGGGDYDFLEAMRLACEAAHPRVRVQIERVEMEGGDKAQTILSQTKMLGIDLLVIGQRRPPSSFLGCKLSGSTQCKGQDLAQFLIEHCKCLCVGVQKKGQNAGYLLNTKTHKNFWLLA